MAKRNIDTPSEPVNCPSCGTDIGRALIGKIIEPQVEQVRIEYERKLAAAADAKAAEMTAAANARLEQQQLLQRDTKEKYQKLIGEKIAELADMDEKLQRSQELEQTALIAKKRLEVEQQEWEVQKARMHNEIARQERERADQLVQERLKVEHDRIDREYRVQIDQLEDRAKRYDEQLTAAVHARKDLEQRLTAKAHADVADEMTALREEVTRQRSARHETETALRGEIGRKDVQFAELKAELSAELETKAEQEKAELRAMHRRQQREQETQRHNTEAELRGELEEKTAEIAQRDAELKKAHEAASSALAERRQLKLEKESWVMEKELMRDQIAAEERQLAEQKAAAQYQARIEVLERDKRGLSEQVEAAHRMASAGTRPQHEGLARQELFAEELRNEWPGDDIQVVKRGQKGADIIHTVRNGRLECGTIVWECKWTQRFEPKWIKKLTEDAKKRGTKIAVLVSAKLPEGVHGSGWVDGIPVCDFATAVHVAGPFRQLMVESKRQAQANAARHGNKDRVYDYVTGAEFAACLQFIVTAVRDSMREIELLDNYITRFRASWTKAQQSIIDTVLTMVGGIEAAGPKLPGSLRGELPSAEHLALPAPAGQAADDNSPDDSTELETAA